MLHVTCDHCGKDIRSGADQHYVVKMECSVAGPLQEITDADLEEGHLEAVSQLLGADDDIVLEEPRRSFRFDLCQECQRRFVRDPLSKEQGHKLFFSKN